MTDYQNRVRRGFRNQGFMRLIGGELRSIDHGVCEIAVPERDDLRQQHGLIHGGVVATIADNAAGFAAMTLMNDNQQPLSVEFKINFVNPAVGGELVARAEVKKNGRRLKICQAEVFCGDPDQASLCAIAIVTVMSLDDDAAGG